MRCGLVRNLRRAPLAAMLGLALTIPVSAQDPGPTPLPSPTPVATPTPPPSPTPTPAPPDHQRPWPSGDQLRRGLQEIGFAFLVDADSGDWLGWPPLSNATEDPALGLGGAGTLAATATFDFGLLDGDRAAELTAFLEVAARLPLEAQDVEQMRRFVVDDLLEAPPELLESCYLADWDRGAALVSVDREAGSARLRLAEAAAGVDLEGEDSSECAPLIPEEVAAALGDPSSERLTIALSGDPADFEPNDVTLQGALVTVVLTFRNDSSVEQSLTFDEPLSSTTGTVAPGEIKLIVVRRLEPGTYPFSNGGDPDSVRGTLRIEAPTAD